MHRIIVYLHHVVFAIEDFCCVQGFLRPDRVTPRAESMRQLTGSVKAINTSSHLTTTTDPLTPIRHASSQ